MLLVASGLSGCGGETSNAQTAAAPPAPVVTVAKPVKKLVSDYDEYVGRFVAVDFVEVRARVSGYLDKIHFTDGQMVKAGDPLFTIDRRPFQAALDQSKAAVVQAQANLAFTDADLKRAENLVRGTSVTQQTLDQRVQTKRVAEANVRTRSRAILSRGRPCVKEIQPPGTRGRLAVDPGARASGTPSGDCYVNCYVDARFEPGFNLTSLRMKHKGAVI